MRTVILAPIRPYARRYIAALLAIIIATGVFVAINAISAAARDGAMETVTRQYPGVDVAATNIGNADDVATFRATAKADPNVTAVAFNGKARADVKFPNGSSQVPIGSVALDSSLRWQKLRSGRMPMSDGEVLVSASSSAREGVRLGSTLDISTDDGPISVTVTGIVNDQDGPLKADLYASETLFPALGNIAESVDMVAAVNGDATAVASRLRKAVPEGSVKTGSDHLRDVRLQSAKGIDNFQKLVSAFAGISLAVGALVFANTLTILLTQRTCDLALLRCVGATRTQVTRSVLIEGLLIGALGSLMGIAAGYLISWGGIAALHALSPGTPMGSPTFSLWELAVPLTAGVGVTAVASYLPARRAAAHSPLQALEPLEPTGPRSKD